MGSAILRTRARRFLAFGFVAAGGALTLSACTAPRVIAVNTFVDGSDANPADGVCEINVGAGDCSLRAAVDESNATSGPVLINVPSGAYSLASGAVDDTNAAGDLDLNTVAHGVTLRGAGPGGVRIDAGGNEAALDVHAGMVDVDALSFTNATEAGVKVSGGELRLRRSASFGNSGSGIAVAAGAVAYTENITLSGNGTGGAAIAGRFGLHYSTVTGNSGGGLGGTGTISFGAAVIGEQVSGADCTTTVTSDGNSVDSDGTCVAVPGTGDVTSADVGLAPLSADLVPWHRPEPGSPAIDAIGVGTFCTSPMQDQVGTLRPVGAACDRGAVEADYTGPPTAFDDTGSTNEASSTNVPVLGNDQDPNPGDILTVISVDTTGTTGTVTNNGTDVTYDPNGQFEHLGSGATAQDSFMYTISDSAGGTATATVTVTINGLNDGPTAVDDAADANEDGPGVVIDVLANDTDVDDLDTQSVTGTGGSPIGNVIMGGSNVTYDPNGQFNSLAAGATATDSFSYTMVDSGGVSSTAIVTVTIHGQNDGPDAVDDDRPGFSTDENTSFTTGDVLANDTDPDAGASLSVTGMSTTGTLGSVTDNGNGTFDYDPGTAFDALGSGQTANDTFTYTVSDGDGGTDTATVTIRINGQNDGPTAVADAASANEDGPAVTVTVLANDTDPDTGDTKVVDSVDTTGTLGTVTNNGTDVSYNPNGAFNSLLSGATATTTFTYTITDGSGAMSTATVTMTVTGQNDAPTAVADSAGANEDGPGVTVNVLANDTDPDSGDTKVVDSINTTGTLGTVTNNGTDVTYNPNGAFNSLLAGATAQTTFAYTVRDGSAATSTATVTMTITGQNDAPTAVADSASTNEDAVGVTLSVLGNDTDPDSGDTKTVQSVGALSNGGSITNNGSTVSFTPGSSFQDLQVGSTRDTSFSYTMVDGSGATSSATVTVTVSGVNDAPVAVNDGTYAGVVGNTKAVLGTTSTGPLVTLTGNVLNQNDTDPDAGDTKSASFVSATAGASVTVNTDGSFVYLPATTTQNTNDTFTYRITDSQGASSTATVTLSVVERVWYVNNTLGVNGTGRSDSPFNVLSSAQTADDSGDYVFLRSGGGSYTGGIALHSSEKLYGEPHGLSVTGAATNPIVSPGGSNPTVTNGAGIGVTLANDVDIQRVDVSGSSGDGISGVNITNATVGANTTISNNGGSEFKVSGNASGTITVNSTITNGSTGIGVDVQGRTSGTATVSGVITSSGGTGVNVGSNSGGTITVSNSITTTGGTGVSVGSNNGSTINFNGAVTASGGPGVNLNTNPSTTIQFAAAIQLSTGTSAAFSATGGGTVTTNSAVVNTLTTTSGTALNVANTNIGAANLTFQSINSSGASNGIVLNTTGSAGGLKITGNSSGSCGGSITVQPVGTPSTANAPTIADCTGGTISGSTGAGISLNSTANVSLQRMRVVNSGTDGIVVTNINGFTLDHSFVTDSSGAAGDRGIEMGDFSTGTAVNGSIAVVDSTVGPTPHDNFGVGIGSGTSTWSISNSVFTGSVLNSGFNFEIRNATVSTFLMSNVVIQNQFADGMQMQPASGVNATITSATIQNSTFVTNNIHMDLNHDGTSNVTYKVLNNTLRLAVANSINVFTSATAGTSGTMNGRFDGNRIGDAAVFNSGGGIGIRVNVNGGAATKVLINNNTIRQVPNGRGIEVISRNGTGGTDATITNNLVNTDFVATVANGGFSLSNIFLQSNCLTVCNTLRTDVRGNNVPAVAPTGELVSGQLVQLRTGLSTNQMVDNPTSSASAAAELAQQNTGSVATTGTITLIAGPIGTPP